MVIWYSSRFIKSFKELPKEIQLLAANKEALFRENPNYSSLHNHPLKGRLKNYFSFRVNYSYRIMYRFDTDGSALFADIGTHSLYQ